MFILFHLVPFFFHWCLSAKKGKRSSYVLADLVLCFSNWQYPEGHTSRSIYVVFKMTTLSDKFPEDLKSLLPSMGVAIWTTTPWTIPANAGEQSSRTLLPIMLCHTS
jgi:hypothetical protein